MTALAGRYFYPHAAHFVAAQAQAGAGRTLSIADEHGAVLAEVTARQVKVTARLASLMRRFDLPDGARFETADNDGADALLWSLRKRRRGIVTDRLERAWPVVGLSLLVTLLAGYYFMVQVVPDAAEALARRTPPSIAHIMSEQTLTVLDRSMLAPTALTPADQARATALFRDVAMHAKGGASSYRLVFRGERPLSNKPDDDDGAMGPNAFALPDGTIVMTDSLWRLVKDDDEIQGVFAHEMSHVDHAHGLQRIYAASLFPAVLALVTGDVSNVSQMAAILPGIIAQSAYSRRFESQADDDGAATLRSMGKKPSHMADLLLRIEASVCKKHKEACGPSWLGDHPGTAARAARLRQEDAGPVLDMEDCRRPWATGISLRCLGFTSR